MKKILIVGLFVSLQLPSIGLLGSVNVDTVPARNSDSHKKTKSDDEIAGYVERIVKPTLRAPYNYARVATSLTPTVVSGLWSNTKDAVKEAHAKYWQEGLKPALKLSYLPYNAASLYGKAQQYPRLYKKYSQKYNLEYDQDALKRILQDHPSFGNYNEIEQRSIIEADKQQQALLLEDQALDEAIRIRTREIFQDLSQITRQLQADKDKGLLPEGNEVAALRYFNETISDLQQKQAELLHFINDGLRNVITLKSDWLNRLKENILTFKDEAPALNLAQRVKKSRNVSFNPYITTITEKVIPEERGTSQKRSSTAEASRFTDTRR